MHEINAADTKNIHIGRQGEDERIQIRFPLADIMEKFPGGSAVLLIMRPEDTEAYPATETEMDDTDLLWTVKEYDLVRRGEGRAQIVYTVQDGAICKSRIWSIHIDESLSVTDEAPPDWEDWVSDLLQAAAGVDASIAAAESTLQEAVEAAETAQGKAEDAQEAAETAQGKAEDAQDAAETAQGKAEDAQAAAEAAQSAAETAQNAAEAAQTAAETAQAAAEAAESAAESAQTAAETAQGKAETAQGKAETAASTATAKATEASQSASTAAQKAYEATVSASSASSSATSAGTAKTDAETAKTAAETAATSASGSATSAQTSASNAASSATAAAGSATDAEGSATSAAESAASAAESASAASQTAEEFADEVEQIEEDVSLLKSAKADVIINSASGAVASFADGANNMDVRSLVVSMEPIQDLHGQDSPYPGGGGKNKFDQDTIYSSYKQSDGSFVCTGSIANNIEFYIPESLVGQVLTFSAYVKVPDGSSITNIRVEAIIGGSTQRGTIVNSSEYDVTSVTFTPASTTDYVKISFGSNGTNNMQFKDVQLEVGSFVSDFDPYSNISPISGWTGLNVYRTGYNVWDETIEQGSYNTSTGAKINGTNNMRSADFIPVSSNTAYCFVCKSARVSQIFWYDSEKNFISNTSNASSSAFTATSPSNAAYVTFQTPEAYGTTYNHDISINYPATDTEYHAYQGTTIPITFPSSAGTVYGGTLTVNEDGTGRVVADRANVDLGTLTWRKPTSTVGKFYASLPYAYQWANNVQMLSSSYLFDGLGNSGAGYYGEDKTIRYYYQTSGSKAYEIYIHDSAHTDSDAATFKAALSASGDQIVYPLATPITYNLTASQITTLLGQNNIWSDSGSVSVEYPADTKLYIDNKLAQLAAQIVS